MLGGARGRRHPLQQQRVFGRDLRGASDPNKLEHRQRGHVLLAAGARGPTPAEPSNRSAWLSITSAAYRSRSSTVARTKILDELLQAVGVTQPQHVSLVRQASHWPPATLSFSGPTRFSTGTRTAVEEDLVEIQIVAIAHRCERPSDHTGQNRSGSSTR